MYKIIVFDLNNYKNKKEKTKNGVINDGLKK